MSVSKSKYKSKLMQNFKISAVKVLLLIPIILFAYMGYSVIFYVGTYNHVYADNLYVSMDEFMESDATHLEFSLRQYEKLKTTYNLPFNLTGDGWDYYPYCDVVYDFNPLSYGLNNETQYLDLVGGDMFNLSNPLNKINYYNGFGHVAVYAGFASIGEAFRYATFKREGNMTGLEESKIELLKIVKAFSLLSEITGDGSMLRFAIPDTPKARELAPSSAFIEDLTDDHLFYKKNFTGPNGKEYTFYCESGTSVDCYLGVYSGLGFIYALCDDLEVRSIVRTTVDRMLEWHVKNSWRFNDYDGKTHGKGAEAFNGFPFVDSSYAITFLRVGKTVNAEKWGDLYDKYVYDRLEVYKVGKHSQLDYYQLFPWSNNGRYFNVNLAQSLAITLVFLENNPTLKQYYRQHFLQPLHDATRYHRNAWFDIGYYLCMCEVDHSKYSSLIEIPDNTNVPQEEIAHIQASVGDCLMRYSLRIKTSRLFRHANGISSYDSNPNWSPIPDAPYPDLKTYESEHYPILDNPFVKIFSEFYYPGNYWDGATPVDWRNPAPWMWEDTAFSKSTGWGSGNIGYCPGDFTTPYWIGRFLQFYTIAV